MEFVRLPAFVLGFHGCHRAVAERVISHKASLLPSKNDYDWLGHGIYFWESDPRRTLLWAREQARRARAKRKKFEPAVVGAVIDLGRCLDLLNSTSIEFVEQAYTFMKKARLKAGAPMPVNQSLRGSRDLLLRKLDCAVINFLHETVADAGDEPFDSVRAAFWEGEPIYPNAGFRRGNHIQICVRNPANIKGYFYARG